MPGPRRLTHQSRIQHFFLAAACITLLSWCTTATTRPLTEGLDDKEMHEIQKNMTAKQSYHDHYDSYTINIVRIAIMFALLVAVFITLFNLHYVQKAFSGWFKKAPAAELKDYNNLYK